MKINVYCDESRQTDSRWMVLGSIWIPKDKEIEFNNICHAFRSKDPKILKAFFKWTKASKGMIDYYKGFSDLFFNFKDIMFRCILIDTHKLDYEKYYEGDKELAFYKFYFYLLSRNMKKEHEYMVFLDRKTNRVAGRLVDLKTALNLYLRKKHSINVNLVSNVEPRMARLYDQLQLVDIFIGAVGYLKEGYNTSPAKLVLADYLMKKKETPFFRISKFWKFNVWELKLADKTKTP